MRGKLRKAARDDSFLLKLISSAAGLDGNAALEKVQSR